MNQVKTIDCLQWWSWKIKSASLFKMWRQIMLSIWILLMISSTNTLSPAEKLISSGSSSYSRFQNKEDVLLMSSAKALLDEFQSDNDQFQDEESPSLSRKKRFVWSSPVAPAVTLRPVDSKRFSKVKVNSAPFLGSDVPITRDIFEVSNTLDRFIF